MPLWVCEAFSAIHHQMPPPGLHFIACISYHPLFTIFRTFRCLSTHSIIIVVVAVVSAAARDLIWELSLELEVKFEGEWWWRRCISDDDGKVVSRYFIARKAELFFVMRCGSSNHTEIIGTHIVLKPCCHGNLFPLRGNLYCLFLNLCLSCND